MPRPNRLVATRILELLVPVVNKSWNFHFIPQNLIWCRYESEILNFKVWWEGLFGRNITLKQNLKMRKKLKKSTWTASPSCSCPCGRRWRRNSARWEAVPEPRNATRHDEDHHLKRSWWEHSKAMHFEDDWTAFPPQHFDQPVKTNEKKANLYFGKVPCGAVSSSSDPHSSNKPHEKFRCLFPVSYTHLTLPTKA